MNVYTSDALYPYLKGEMLGNQQTVRIIKSFAMEEIWSKEKRAKVPTPVIGFEGTTKKLILSSLNLDRIVHLYGPETNDWIGKPVKLYAEKVKVGGVEHMPVRVSLERPSIPQKSSQNQRLSSTAN